MVRAYGMLSNPIPIGNGLKQGCILAPILFNIYMDAIIKLLLRDCPYGVKLVFRTNGELVEPQKGGKLDIEMLIQCLLFADDLVIISDSRIGLEECLTKFDTIAGNMGLTVAIEKTKVMELGPKDPQWKVILRSQEVEKVECFDYLGSRFDERCDIGVEVQRRITKAAGSFASLYNPLWRQKSIPIITKVHVFNAMIIPCLLYGSETWVLLKEHVERLESFQMKCLRKICGISKIEHKRNISVREMAGQQRIEAIIMRNRLRWLGHCQRMENNRIPKRAMRCWIKGKKRARGRPSKRWSDCVGEDLTYMELRNKSWQNIATNRNSWREECKKAIQKLNSSRDTKDETLYKEKKEAQKDPQRKECKCEKCGAFFTTEAGVKRHIIWKHTVRKKCLSCNKEFLSENALKKHSIYTGHPIPALVMQRR